MLETTNSYKVKGAYFILTYQSEGTYLPTKVLLVHEGNANDMHRKALEKDNPRNKTAESEIWFYVPCNQFSGIL